MIGDRWGVTDDETSRAYPCDGLVDRPNLVAWRGVTVVAPAEVLWSWLVQVRVAPYSYDLVDNLGRRSPRELLGLRDPVPGDPFSATAGRPLGRVVSVSHGRHLTARIMGVHLSYVLTPIDDRSTRLVLKLAGRHRPLVAPLLCLGDLPMARRQLLNFKRLAEATAVTGHERPSG